MRILRNNRRRNNMAVARGTTPTFELTFTDEELDLTQASHVYVTFKSAGLTLTKKDEDLIVEEKKIQVFLSQADTLQLYEAKIQANWTTAGGVRAASEIITYKLDDQLLEKVVE